MAMTKAEREAQLFDKNEIVILRQKIIELEKKVTDTKNTSDNWYRRMNEVDQEIQAVHGILDCLPTAPSRKTEDGYTARPLMARLAGYFATR